MEVTEGYQWDTFRECRFLRRKVRGNLQISCDLLLLLLAVQHILISVCWSVCLSVCLSFWLSEWSNTKSFWKIFHYRRFDGVTALQHFLNRPTWEELTERRCRGFEMRVRTAGQSTPAFIELNCHWYFCSFAFVAHCHCATHLCVITNYKNNYTT